MGAAIPATLHREDEGTDGVLERTPRASVGARDSEEKEGHGDGSMARDIFSGAAGDPYFMVYAKTYGDAVGRGLAIFYYF